MKCATRKLRGFAKWHGGKTYLARRIIQLFPEHEAYVEPFVGGGSVLLNKQTARVESATDLNADLIRVYKALQECPTAVIESLRDTPYDRDRFGDAKHRLERGLCETDIDFAVDFIVKNRMSRGGMGKDFAWSERLRGGQPGDVNAWKTVVENLPAVAERISGVMFASRSAVDAIRVWDDKETLFYCDPPYVHSARTAKKAYGEFEMTDAQHRELLDVLKACKGKVFISGYRNPLYDEQLAGWRRTEFEIANHSGQGKQKQRRVECVWDNTPLGA